MGLRRQKTMTAIIMSIVLLGGGVNVYAEDIQTESDEALSFHVAPNGDDAWDGSEEHPFQTIQRAQQAVRQNNDDMERDIRVVIHEGTYFMDSTLEFTPEDSADNGYRISYEAAPGENVLISGGVQLEGKWEDTGNGIYKTNAGDKRFRQLYVNGQKAYRSTTRDITTTGQEEFNYFRAYWQRDAERYKLKVKKEDFDLLGLSKEALKQTEAVIIQHWSESYVRFEDIISSDDDVQTVSIQKEEHDILSRRGYSILRDGDPYYLENALAFVDQGGEWFLDNITGDLYYKLRDGESIDQLEMTVPVTETLWRIEGTFDEPIENLEIHGLDFAYTTWMRPNEYGHICAQAGLYNTKTELPNDQWVERPAAGIEVSATRNFVFERNRLYNMGATGLDLHLGTQNSAVEGNVIKNISGNGIMLAEFSPGEFHIPYNPEDPREICKDDRIVNNYITNIATDYLGSTAIAAGYPQGAVIEHNEIHNTPYTAITVGWGWHHEQKTPMEYNMIRYNEIYDVVRLMSDGAAIYTLSYQPGSQITENYIHDLSYNAPTQPAPVCAIFLDEGSGGLTVKENVITNMEAGTRRIFQNANSNPVTDNTKLLAEVVQNAGLEAEYIDIKTGTSQEMPIIKAVESPVNAGESVVVSGQNFGTEKGSVHIVSAGLDYETASDKIQAWGENEIICTVPLEIEEKDAELYVETAVGRTSNKMPLEVLTAGTLDITEKFDYDEGDLPVNAVWASQNNAKIVISDDEHVLRVSSNGKNGKAVMASTADNYTLVFDMMLETEPFNMGDGLYLTFRDNMRLEWIAHPTENSFSLSKNGVRISGSDYKPAVDQWQTVKLEVTGDKFKAKIWERGQEEPETWMAETELAGTNVPLSFEYFHSAGGALLFDNIQLKEAEELEDGSKGQPRTIDFESYDEGPLADENIFETIDGAFIRSEDGNKLLSLKGKGSNSIAALRGEYKNYNLQMDVRFDSALNENASEGLYFLLKTNGGNDYVRAEYLPEWKDIFTIKNGPSTILDKNDDVKPEYGKWYTIKVSVKGSEYQAKVWEKGSAEPEEWTLSAQNENVPLGKISIEYYAQTADMSIDNIVITDVDFSETDTVKIVTGTETLEEKVVWSGSSPYTFGLPEYVKLQINGRVEERVARAVWQYQTYKPKNTEDQVIEGILKTDYAVKNPDDIKAEVKIITIDDSGLRGAVSDAEAKAENAYTEESWSRVESALAEAKKLLDAEPVSREDTDQKTASLCRAVQELELSESMDTLKVLLADAAQLLDSTKDSLYESEETAYNGEYSKDAYHDLEKNLAEANEVYEELLTDTELSEEEFEIKLSGAVHSVKTGIEMLKGSQKRIETKVLEGLIAAAKELKGEAYTEESYGRLIEEMRKAEELLEGKFTQQMMDERIEQLEKAFDSLVYVEEAQPGSEETSDVAGKSEETNSAVKTGDDGFLYRYLGMALLALISTISFIKKRRQQ